ncbi:MAG: hypothetical protein Satyrvirus1_49 [Satyrvirus sp.]|uniref:Uncharacterized protein n=1 Tax=Satyrvirus sp. TaxID=2487771 RepID=A0A3G5AGE2_9VIRU|nr:MAG: hypothetical protein Satyrvirus1_49 [Satyrvirus sp.]
MRDDGTTYRIILNKPCYSNSLLFSALGTTNLTFIDETSTQTFEIALKFAKFSFDIDIEGTRISRHFQHYQENICKLKIAKKVQLIGVSVGDIFKHYYYTNYGKKNFQSDPPNEIEIEIEIENEIETGTDAKENILFEKHIKKSLSIDTSNSNVADALGILSHVRSIILWDFNSTEKLTTKKQTINFGDFCGKILYMSVDTINDLLKRSQDNVIYTNDSLCTKVFEELTNEVLVKKLLRYFLYGENPETSREVDIHIFDPPKNIPDILKDIEKENKNFHYYYHKIMKTPNKREQETLQKYQPTTFKNMKQVPETYPPYSLRTISLENWDSLSFTYLMALCDSYVKYRKNGKFKFKSEKISKISRINDPYFYIGKCDCDCKWCKKSFRRLHEQKLSEYMAENDIFNDDKYDDLSDFGEDNEQPCTVPTLVWDYIVSEIKY